MKKAFLLKGLDCPHCAAKIEKEISSLKGVDFACVNLMSQTLTLECGKGDILAEIERIVHLHEPDVSVSELSSGTDTDSEEKTGAEKPLLFRMALGGVLFLLALILGAFADLPPAIFPIIYIPSYLTLGVDVLLKALRGIVKGKVFDENFLMSLSTAGAFAIGEYPEAVAVMLFYQLGEYFEERSVAHSRASVKALVNIRPERATLVRDGEQTELDARDVGIGETILIKAGERIPLDGVVTEGESQIDCSALTGESLPIKVSTGTKVLSGCINQSGVIKVKVEKSFEGSAASKVIELVRCAAERKAPTERFITKFAGIYTPAVVILAVMIAAIPPLFFSADPIAWLRRAMVFLVISCPCALVISVPLAFFAGIGEASAHGILVKGGNYLEALSAVDTVVFDKTGTLTEGKFKVNKLVCARGYSEQDLLYIAAHAEALSNHPIASAVISAYGKEPKRAALSAPREIAGKGVCALFNGKKIAVGNAALMYDENIAFCESKESGTKIYVADGGAYAGCIIISDRVKSDAKNALQKLKKLGVRRTVMLSGDSEENCAAVAGELGIDSYSSSLLPQGKIDALEAVLSEKKKGRAVFVGDGINDAPVLARADVGVAMGALGQDAAIEAADAVLMTDDLSKLAVAIKIARATRRVVIVNIVMSLCIKGLFLTLGAFGLVGMWEAVFADVGVALIAVLNSMRIFKKKIK